MTRTHTQFVALLLLVACGSAFAQANRGELRIDVADPTGAAVPATIEIASAANGYDRFFLCDPHGRLAVQLLPFGAYQLRVRQPGFSPYNALIEVRSAVPQEQHVRLALASVRTQITVNADATLLDPGSPSSAVQIGSQQIGQRLTSLPGRSVQDLVVVQPGWLYEGNAVLHPRGSEYQTQFVVDGIPLTDNRSPGTGPEIEADDLDSVSIYTAGYPAEYGRKLGGVVELNTRRQTDPGLHGSMVLSGGSYDTANGYGSLQETTHNTTLEATAAGAHTLHFLNPVVPQNFTNTGTSGDFSGRFERDIDSNDRIDINLRHELARYLIPNELVQQQAGQIQNGGNSETLGMAAWQRILSPDSLLHISGMLRGNRSQLASNTNPTPIAAFLHNSFSEGYVKAAYALHHGPHEFKTGVESDSTFLHERFNYAITDPGQFDPGTPPSIAFAGSRPDLEQGAFAQDLLHIHHWTIAAGLRWDHYQLLLNQNAFSPRIAVSRYLPAANLVLHASYDRIFQTPAFENILLSSSPQVQALSPEFLRLPVQPSRGNYFEVGLAQAIAGRTRLDLNLYRRQAANFADDNQLLNTGVSYPIAFHKAVIYGAEIRLQLVGRGPFSGFASYSDMLGNVWFPVTGGLFLGQDAAAALSQLSGHFPNSQDQRNTLATRWQWKFAPRASLAAGAAYGSGLPFDYGGTEDQALAIYGPQIVSRLNFDRGRIRPSLDVNSSLAVDLYRHENVAMTLRVDGENLNNRLNVLDFGGLFSGNAIAPARSVQARYDLRF
ncbi:MAG TPA: TonB-dependent receptor plug domain-containing protein [Terracidiphilus sp.]|nr:TonB-dependent receptor plug domain-containing protein [Terracidiphilus sp.]